MIARLVLWLSLCSLLGSCGVPLNRPVQTVVWSRTETFTDLDRQVGPISAIATPCGDGGVVVAFIMSYQVIASDFFVGTVEYFHAMKFSPSGHVVWSVSDSLPGGCSGEVRDVVTSEEGLIFLITQTNIDSTRAGVAGHISQLLMLNQDGYTAWRKDLNENGALFCNSISPLMDGGFILTGQGLPIPDELVTKVDRTANDTIPVRFSWHSELKERTNLLLRLNEACGEVWRSDYSRIGSIPIVNYGWTSSAVEFDSGSFLVQGHQRCGYFGGRWLGASYLAWIDHTGKLIRGVVFDEPEQFYISHLYTGDSVTFFIGSSGDDWSGYSRIFGALDDEGEIVWDSCWTAPEYLMLGRFPRAAYLSPNELVILGQERLSDSLRNLHMDCFDPFGNCIWSAEHEVQVSQYIELCDLVLSIDGSVYLIGLETAHRGYFSHDCLLHIWKIQNPDFTRTLSQD